MPAARFHTVVSGDTFHRIATNHDLSVRELAERNPQITDPSRLFPGDKIRLSPADARAEAHGDIFVGSDPELSSGYKPVTLNQLESIFPTTRKSQLLKMLGPLNRAMNEFEINTPRRQAYFLAQVGHESMGLTRTEELSSGRAYEGRRDLGNTRRGDGVRFKGRGLLQITGRANYKSTGRALGLDLIANPQILETPRVAARSAGHFWHSRGLNELADRGAFKRITKRINGGYTGLSDRLNHLKRAERAIH